MPISDFGDLNKNSSCCLISSSPIVGSQNAYPQQIKYSLSQSSNSLTHRLLMVVRSRKSFNAGAKAAYSPVPAHSADNTWKSFRTGATVGFNRLSRTGAGLQSDRTT